MRREMQHGQALDSSAQPERPLPARRRPRWDEASVICALRAWAAEHDGVAPRFNDWHADQHPDYLASPERFPAGQTVMKLFESWQAACDAAGLQPRPRRRPVRVAPGRSRPRIVAALRAWADEHDGLAPRCGDWGGKSSHADYRGERPRWLSSTTVLQVFGSWQAACDAAGVQQRPRSSGRVNDRSTPWGARQPRWSDQDLLDALLAWAAEHDGYAPRIDDWSTSNRARLHAAGAPGARRWPSAQTVASRFGSWQAACAAAGLPQRPVKAQPEPWPRAQILQALRGWADEHDGLAPRSSDWHANSGHQDFVADRDRWPPTRRVLHVFGSWQAACAEAKLTPRPSQRGRQGPRA